MEKLSNCSIFKELSVGEIFANGFGRNLFFGWCSYLGESKTFIMNQDALTDMKWRRLDGRRIELPIADAVRNTLIREKEAGHRLKVCIGTDSQVRGKVTEFATVIVFVREKKGGFMFITNYKSLQKMTIRERMILEVARSVEISYALCNLLDEHNVELEVHADINTDPSFESNTALKEAMGYILGMGFVFKAKPDAFASSACADKVC